MLYFYLTVLIAVWIGFSAWDGRSSHRSQNALD